jgi:magnesium chelatase family protein
MTPRQLACHCALAPAGRELLARAAARLGLSARGHDRVLKVARTIADLADAETIVVEHLAEALAYRALDRGVG